MRYASVCVRSSGSTNASCAFSSVGDFFGNDAALVQSLSAEEVLRRLTTTVGVNALGQSVSLETLAGGVTRDAAGVIVGAEALRLQGLLRDVRKKLFGKVDADPDSYSVQLKVYDRAWGASLCRATVPVYSWCNSPLTPTLGCVCVCACRVTDRVAVWHVRAEAVRPQRRVSHSRLTDSSSSATAAKAAHLRRCSCRFP